MWIKNNFTQPLPQTHSGRSKLASSAGHRCLKTQTNAVRNDDDEHRPVIMKDSLTPI